MIKLMFVLTVPLGKTGRVKCPKAPQTECQTTVSYCFRGCRFYESQYISRLYIYQGNCTISMTVELQCI